MRVAVATNTATGASAPTTARTRMRMAAGGKSGGRDVVRNEVTASAPLPVSELGSAPITATSSCGERSPSGPIVPTTRPMRGASWSAGVRARRSARAGETYASPGPGSRVSPGGVGASAVSGARKMRTSGWPANRSSPPAMSSRGWASPGGSGWRHAWRESRSPRAGWNDMANSRIAVPIATAAAVSATEKADRRPSARASRSPRRIIWPRR